MKTYLLLLGIACAPILASSLLTFPLWLIRKISNDKIRGITILLLILVLISCYITLFFDETLELGFMFIPLSLLNFPLLSLFTRLLYTSRCPECRSLSLCVSGRSRRKYRLRCRCCGTQTSWRPWSPVPDIEK